MCWARRDSVREARRSEARRWSERETARPVRTPANVRVSDADRQDTIDQLRHHTADGRLTLEEFEARVEEALAARTGRDLEAVMRDLPSIAAPARRHRPHRRPVPVAALLASPLVLVAIGVAAVSLAVGQLVLWPLFVVGGLWLFGGCGRVDRRHHGHDRYQPKEQADEGDDALTMV